MTKILFVKDDPDSHLNLKHVLLESKFEVIEAKSSEEAMKKLDKELPAIILLDIIMSKINGVEVCRKIRRGHKYQNFYIIIMTRAEDIENNINSLESGADDFIIKPFDEKELILRIKSGIRNIEARSLAYHDPLTKLYNRHFYNNNLVPELERAERYDSPVSIIVMDIDHFKAVNDTYGHQTGDLILIEVAKIIMEICRTSDFAYRWGGDEFAILLPNTRLKGANILANRLIKRIAKKSFKEVGHLSASAGVSFFTKEEPDIFQKADEALYKAKKDGRNRVVVA